MLEVELKIEDKKRKILERFQDIIENNYENNENTGDYSIYDPAVLHLQHENFGVTPQNRKNVETKKKTTWLMMRMTTLFF